MAVQCISNILVPCLPVKQNKKRFPVPFASSGMLNQIQSHPMKHPVQMCIIVLVGHSLPSNDQWVAQDAPEKHTLPQSHQVGTPMLQTPKYNHITKQNRSEYRRSIMSRRNCKLCLTLTKIDSLSQLIVTFLVSRICFNSSSRIKRAFFVDPWKVKGKMQSRTVRRKARHFGFILTFI